MYSSQQVAGCPSVYLENIAGTPTKVENQEYDQNTQKHLTNRWIDTLLSSWATKKSYQRDESNNWHLDLKT